MADLTPEVMNALVRLMNGEVDLDAMSTEQLYELVSALHPERASRTLAQALAVLNVREVDGRRQTFAIIGDRIGVHEATAARWAKPPGEDRRRRRVGDQS